MLLCVFERRGKREREGRGRLGRIWGAEGGFGGNYFGRGEGERGWDGRRWVLVGL